GGKFAGQPSWPVNPSSITVKSSAGGSATRVLQLAVIEQIDPVPDGTFRITAVSPNPTPRGVLIRYSVGRESHVRLGVRDAMGREVALLADGLQSAGGHEVVWEGAPASAAAPPGIYFVCLETPAGRWVRRLAVLK